MTPHGRHRSRWVASRWALRGVLARYLGEDPTMIGLRLGEHGKPELADPEATLRFNLSHSAGRALVAVATGVEVGVDIERLGRRTAPHYTAWARREAIAKCHGVGLWKPLPERPVAVSNFDVGAGFAAALAVAGESVPPLRLFALPLEWHPHSWRAAPPLPNAGSPVPAGR